MLGRVLCLVWLLLGLSACGGTYEEFVEQTTPVTTPAAPATNEAQLEETVDVIEEEDGYTDIPCNTACKECRRQCYLQYGAGNTCWRGC